MRDKGVAPFIFVSTMSFPGSGTGATYKEAKNGSSSPVLVR